MSEPLSSLSEKAREKIRQEMARYETTASAILPALYIVQEECQGWVTESLIQELSKFMDIPPSRIQEVAHFYTLINKKPVGKYHVQICCNLSCSLNGGRELADFLSHELKLDYGEVSEDGKFTLTRVECLGSCGTAPMMQINDRYYENLTPESAMNILRGLR